MLAGGVDPVEVEVGGDVAGGVVDVGVIVGGSVVVAPEPTDLRMAVVADAAAAEETQNPATGSA